jgi:hypothetical protein
MLKSLLQATTAVYPSLLEYKLAGVRKYHFIGQRIQRL